MSGRLGRYESSDQLILKPLVNIAGLHPWLLQFLRNISSQSLTGLSILTASADGHISNTSACMLQPCGIQSYLSIQTAALTV